MGGLDRSFEQLVAEGAVPGYSMVEKFGENPDIDVAGTPAVIWSYGGMYTYSDTADIDSIVGEDALDITEVTIQGLDANWALVTQTVTLNGQTRVALSTPLIRCFRMWNSGAIPFLGPVYVYVNTAIVAGVPTDGTKVRAEIHLDASTGLSSGQTEMALFTVPDGYRGYLYNGYVGISRGGNLATAEFTPQVRTNGGVFRTIYRAAVIGQGNSHLQQPYRFPIQIPPKSDFQVVCVNVGANDTGVFAGFTIVLKKIGA